MLLFILLYFFVSINIARCVTTADQCGNNHVVLGTACPKMVTEARRGKETIGELRLAAVATCIAWEWMKCKFGWCMWSLRFVHTYSAHTHIILECIMYIDTREYLYTIHCSCEERCVCMVVSMCGYTLCVCGSSSGWLISWLSLKVCSHTSHYSSTSFAFVDILVYASPFLPP